MRHNLGVCLIEKYLYGGGDFENVDAGISLLNTQIIRRGNTDSYPVIAITSLLLKVFKKSRADKYQLLLRTYINDNALKYHKDNLDIQNILTAYLSSEDLIEEDSDLLMYY